MDMMNVQAELNVEVCGACDDLFKMLANRRWHRLRQAMQLRLALSATVRTSDTARDKGLLPQTPL